MKACWEGLFRGRQQTPRPTPRALRAARPQEGRVNPAASTLGKAQGPQEGTRLQPARESPRTWQRREEGARPPGGARTPHLQGQGVPLGGLAHQALLFALLEFPEILLDQESSVKLAHRDLII